MSITNKFLYRNQTLIPISKTILNKRKSFILKNKDSEDSLFIIEEIHQLKNSNGCYKTAISEIKEKIKGNKIILIDFNNIIRALIYQKYILTKSIIK